MEGELREIRTERTQLDLGAIKPDPMRPRQRQRRSVHEIAKSIREFGFVQPIVVDEDYSVIIGHGRLEAARRLGFVMVPVIVVRGLNAAQRWRLQIADNRLAELSDWDEARLIDRMEQLCNGNRAEVPGFSSEEINDILGEVDLRNANRELPPHREKTQEQSELHLLVSCRASSFGRMAELLEALKGESWCTLEQGIR